MAYTGSVDVLNPVWSASLRVWEPAKIMTKIIAMGGGGFEGPEDAKMHRYVLSKAATEKPKLCFIATGKGDRPETIQAFYNAFLNYPCTVSHLALFDREVEDLRSFLLSQDILFVWGGNTVSMLAVWRAHGVDKMLREALEAGVVLAGACAGALACFDDGITDSFGGLHPIRDGLGFLSGSLCPYFDADLKRRPVYEKLIASGEMIEGIALDVGVGLFYENGELSEVVAQNSGVHARRFCLADGQFSEVKLPSRLLP